MDSVEIPNDWNPRRHQQRLWLWMKAGGSAKGKRGAAVWHRRAGKDDTAMNLIADESFERTGTYWHMLPAATQARKVVWDSINIRGQRRIDQAFPHAIRSGQANKTEMKIELVNGSVYQCVGSDHFESLLGANPVGVVFSEWQRANPAAWDYIRPILRENGGWALFIYTPFGRNHGKTTFDTFTELAKTNPRYFAEKLDIRDTKLLTLADIEEERLEGMSEGMIQQEYYCSFTAPTEGAYYAKEMAHLESIGGFGDFPHDPALPVHTCWDIGFGHTTAVWFFQLHPVSPIVHFIDFYQGAGEGLSHYARVIQARAQEKGYIYGEHIAPHDMGAGEWGTGESRVARAKGYGIKFKINPRIKSKAETRDLVKVTLPLCRFNKATCERGLDCLWTFHAKYYEKLKAWSDEPEDDWASDGSDAFGEGAKRIKRLRRRLQAEPRTAPRAAGDWMAS